MQPPTTIYMTAPMPELSSRLFLTSHVHWAQHHICEERVRRQHAAHGHKQEECQEHQLTALEGRLQEARDEQGHQQAELEP